MENRELVMEAVKARKQAYCPYSGFAVGAVIKPDLSAERFSVSLPAWQRKTNYIKGTSITDSTIFQD